MADIGVNSTSSFSGEGVRRRSPVARALFGDVVQFIDFIIVIASSVAVAYAYHVFALQTEFDFQNYAAAGIVGATGLTALLRRDGYYDFDQLLSSSGSLRAIVSRWILVVLSLLAFGFALKISENFSRVWLFAWSGSVIASIFLSRAISEAALRAMSRDGGAFARRIAIVGANELGAKFAEQTGALENGISIVGVFDAGLANTSDKDCPTVSGDLNALASAARNGEIDDIVIAAPGASREDMARLVRLLSILPVSISISANRHWLDHMGGAVANVGGASVLSLYRRPLEGWGGVLKTIEDFVLGSVFLLLASPILLLAALAIRLEGKGPILFAQQRHGFNNAVFKIYKFRTMTVAEDGDTVTQARENDPRITRVGRFLRRYSIDELPQLINVIRGEMSLVGPRPHALAHNHQYAQTIENYSGRHKVKPGITGWAQVNGFRGETSENELMAERVRYDLAYVDNWSLWFDFKILVLTVKAVLFPKNAV
ncbi:MAG: undecaprenyl-phosphate glucose phosphotransferase [Hyphococcus sp.]